MITWLTILVTLLIVVVIAHGVIRTWKERRDRLFISPSLKKSLKNSSAPVEEEKEVPSYISELPNGGARVVGYRDPKDIPQPKTTTSYAKEQKEARQKEEVVKRPEQARLNLNETVPILMQPAQMPSAQKQQRIEPVISSDESLDELEAGTEKPESFSRTEPLVESKNISSSQQDNEEDYDEYEKDEDEYDEDEFDEDYDDEVEGTDDDEDSEEYDEEYDDDESEYEDDGDYDDADSDDYDEAELEETEFDEVDDESSPSITASRDEELEEVISSTETSNAANYAEPEEVIVINVMAPRAQVFEGNALLDVALKCGLRYGNMNIFHRYSGNKGDGTLLFSMANIIKPGTFDLDAMDEFTTLGVSLFLTLPLDADSLQSFELMLETAQAFTDTLGGEMKDEYRSVLTKQTIEHYRQRIRDFERKKLFRRPR